MPPLIESKFPGFRSTDYFKPLSKVNLARLLFARFQESRGKLKLGHLSRLWKIKNNLHCKALFAIWFA